MFHLTKTEFINKTIRLPVNLLDTLEKLADEKELSLTKVVVQCCEYAIANLHRDEKKA